MDNKLAEIELLPEHLLITPIKDYFDKKINSTINTNTQKANTFSVGVVSLVAEDLPKEWVGKTVYYHKNIADVIDIRGIGTYEKAHKSIILLLRGDEKQV